MKVKFYDEIVPNTTAYYFNNLVNLSSFENMNNLETGLVTDMQYMFAGCSSLTSIDVSHFDTSNVTNMESMFRGSETKKRTGGGYSYFCVGNIAELDLSNFNTSKVINMGAMFYNQVALKNVNVTSFDTSNVTNMSGMFEHWPYLTELDLSSFDTSQVTSMGGMFRLDATLSWTDDYYYNGAYGGMGNNLKTIFVSNLWDVSNVSTTSSWMMFEKCNNIVGGNGTVYNSSKTDVTYAHIDEEDNPGYLTLKTN